MPLFGERIGVSIYGPVPMTELDMLELCCRAFNAATPEAELVAPAALDGPLVLMHDGRPAVRFDRTTVWRAGETVSEFAIEHPRGPTIVEISIAWDTKLGFSAGGDDDWVHFDAIARSARRAPCEWLLNHVLDVTHHNLRWKWRYYC